MSFEGVVGRIRGEGGLVSVQSAVLVAGGVMRLREEVLGGSRSVLEVSLLIGHCFVYEVYL